MRSAVLIAFSAVVTLAVACGGQTLADHSTGKGTTGDATGGTCVDFNASSFSTACDQPSDCFPFFAGQACEGQCACPNAAASVAAQSTYDSALASVQLGDCFCPDAVPTCEDHQCGIQHPGGGSGGSSDGGACVDVDLATYDQSCQSTTDCVEISSGVICPGACSCGGSVINASGEARYRATVGGLQTGECPCPYFGAPTCVGGQCVLCFPGSTTPGCPDAG